MVTTAAQNFEILGLKYRKTGDGIYDVVVSDTVVGQVQRVMGGYFSAHTVTGENLSTVSAHSPWFRYRDEAAGAVARYHLTH